MGEKQILPPRFARSQDDTLNGPNRTLDPRPSVYERATPAATVRGLRFDETDVAPGSALAPLCPSSRPPGHGPVLKSTLSPRGLMRSVRFVGATLTLFAVAV